MRVFVLLMTIALSLVVVCFGLEGEELRECVHLWATALPNLWFLMLATYISVGDGVRYFLPQESFWVLPMSRYSAIRVSIEKLLKWRFSLFMNVLFVVCMFITDVPIADKMLYTLVYVMSFASFVFASSVIWHTLCKKKHIKECMNIASMSLPILVLAKSYVGLYMIVLSVAMVILSVCLLAFGMTVYKTR